VFARARFRSSVPLACLAALGAGLAPVTSHAQTVEQAVLQGAVLERASGVPVEGATLVLDGTGRRAFTDARGRFDFQSVPAGDWTLRVERLGFHDASVTVQLRTGAVTDVEIHLDARPLELDRLVATATGRQRAREVAHDVARIEAGPVLERAPVRTLAELVRARAPGVQVLSSSGAVGAGTRIRVRGAGSINLPNDPVVFVDGARVDADPLSGSINVGGQVPSRLDDLNPEEIESIEIVRGPSAATLYGTDAAAGVVRITTRRGRPGPLRLEAWSEAGWSSDRNAYPDNYFGRTADGAECFVFLVTLGLCQQADQLRSNPLRHPASTPFRTGGRGQVGVRMSGGSEGLDYFLFGARESVGGVFRLPDFDRAALRQSLGDAWDRLPESQFRPDALERLSLRANVGGRVAEHTVLRLHTGLLRSRLTLPQNDNNFLGVLPSGLLGWPDAGPGNRFGYRFYVPSEIYAQAVTQDVDRLLSSVNLRSDPRPWLELRAVAGLDLVTRVDERAVPRDRIFFGSVLPLGVRDVNTARVRTTSLEAGASVRHRTGPDLATRSTVGAQYVGRSFTRTDAHGEDLPPGAGSISDAARTSADEQRARSRTLGLYVEQEVAWRDRLFVSGALRADDNSAFGADFDVILYPKLGVSWVLRDEFADPAQGRLAWIDDARLRAAWGQSGAQPSPGDALADYDARAVTVDGGDRLGVSLARAGNPGLEPERSSEFEAGLDVHALSGRVSLALTGYLQTTRDLLLWQALPPSAGAGAERLVNLGEVRNRGLEALVHARLVERGTLQWSLTLSGSSNRNELVDLGTGPDGEPTPLIEQGIQRFVEGYPLGGYWDRPMGFRDFDGDGLIHPEEVAVGDEAVYLGSALPTRELALATTLELFRGRVALSALVEHRGGHVLRNQTEVLRCQYTICRGYNDPTASLLEQARALTQTVRSQDLATEAGFVEDASFWKLREVGLTWRVPERFARRASARALSVTVAAANLATWTGYGGLDPELNQQAQRGFLSRDLFTQPPVRTVTFRVQAAF
jgi:TonB-dependent SusC/RagA subfamily outer membrane receptor